MNTSAPRLTDQQRLDWLRLIRSESVGPKTFKALINRYGGAGAALEALPGLAAQRGRRIAIASREDCVREMEAVAADGAQLLALGEPEYPAALAAIDAAPPLLAVKGEVSALGRPCVAIVGSRNASAAGLAFCERLARDLGEAGFIVVSGLARGIDARAHRSALARGTVAVLAGGLNRIYPTEHVPLARELMERGALISEMPMGYEPRGRDFPRRNRLVSGLALGVVVIEAARRSGSLITARFASEQGREIFAVPGSPLDPRTEGALGLLREGATLCTRAADVIDALTPLLTSGARPHSLLGEDKAREPDEPLWDELDIDYGEAPRSDPGAEMDEAAAATKFEHRKELIVGVDAVEMLERLLGPTPVTMDDLARAADLPVAAVRAGLLDLELAGRIERHPSGQVSLLPHSTQAQSGQSLDATE